MHFYSYSFNVPNIDPKPIAMVLSMTYDFRCTCVFSSKLLLAPVFLIS